MEKRKKIIVILVTIVLTVGFVILGVLLRKKMRCQGIEKPPVVDHFACSDYCPSPREKYMVKIYQGVEDEEECRRICGKPFTYYGWGEYHICIAE